ncbi:hypothetical protein Tco_1547576 [Tanacetum coccineum]
MSKEFSTMAFTDTWISIGAINGEIAPTTLEGVNQRVTDLSTIVEQETYQQYDIWRMLKMTGKYSYKEPESTVDASDYARSDVHVITTMNSDDRVSEASMDTQKVLAQEKPDTREAGSSYLALKSTKEKDHCHAMINEGVTAELAARDATRNVDDSHTSGTGARRPVQVARECTYPDFLKCQPLNFKGTEGVVGLTQWFEKMESVYSISNHNIACQSNLLCVPASKCSYMWKLRC